jgi:hypothetical protein
MYVNIIREMLNNLFRLKLYSAASINTRQINKYKNKNAKVYLAGSDGDKIITTPKIKAITKLKINRTDFSFILKL